MSEEDKRNERYKKIIESFLLLIVTSLLSTIVVLISTCYFEPSKDSETMQPLLTTIVSTMSIFLGFLLTAITLKLNQLDNKINDVINDINDTIYQNDGSIICRNYHLSQDEVKVLKISTEKLEKQNLITNLQDNLEILCYFRKYQKQWMWYPFSYSLVVIFGATLLMIITGIFPKVTNTYIFFLAFVGFFSIASLYISIKFISKFSENSFINKNN